MGVTGLYGFLCRICKETGIDAIKKYHASKFKGKMMVVDALQKLYRHGIAMRNTGDKLNRSGRRINHMYAITNYILFLIENGIKPVCVFDGKSPEIKTDTVEERRQKKYNATKKCDEIEDKESEEYIRQSKKAYTITWEDINDCKKLLEAFGLPYVEAVGEADSQCAGIVIADADFYGGITDDIDTLVFGVNKMLKDFSRKNQGYAVELSHSELMRALLVMANKIRTEEHMLSLNEFTYENFIDFVSLLETDYFGGIKSPSHLELFRDYVINNLNVPELIEYITKTKKSYFVPDNFWTKWEEVRKYYLTAEIVKPTVANKTFKKPDQIAIHRILYDECGFEQMEVERISKQINEFYQLYVSRPSTSYGSFVSKKMSHPTRSRTRYNPTSDYFGNLLPKNDRGVTW